MGVLVKVMPLDDLFDRWRNEITNGLPLRNSLSDFRRRNVDRPADGAVGRNGGVPAAVQDNKFRQLPQIVDPVPRLEPR